MLNKIQRRILYEIVDEYECFLKRPPDGSSNSFKSIPASIVWIFLFHFNSDLAEKEESNEN